MAFYPYFYKQHQRDLYYLRGAILVGKYDFPLLQPTKTIPRNVYSFTERKSLHNPKDKWIDFFVDDTHFLIMKNIKYLSIFKDLEKLNKNPAIRELLSALKYKNLYNIYIRLDKIMKSIIHFEGIITPDFSLYPEMAIIDRIHNVRLSRSIAYYMQQSGINIIPSATWADINDFEWCLDGIPQHNSVAISTNGCKSEGYSKKIFLERTAILQHKLKPYKLIIYGSSFNELQEYKNIIYYPSYSQRLNAKLKLEGKQYEFPFMKLSKRNSDCIVM